MSYAVSQVPAGAFAYVPQDNFLFAGKIRENVASAAPDANGDQVRRACEVACAWGFVKELPQGVEANIAALPEKRRSLWPRIARRPASSPPCAFA